MHSHTHAHTLPVPAKCIEIPNINKASVFLKWTKRRFSSFGRETARCKWIAREVNTQNIGFMRHTIFIVMKHETSIIVKSNILLRLELTS